MADPERIVFLDTETTGLYVSQGHRIIEVAAIEARGRSLTGRQLHYYVNPEREIDDAALAVHGLSSEFLADKPVFGQIACELADFIDGSSLHIHNAKFDVEFLDAEFNRLGMKSVAELDIEVVDVLALARRRFPGKRNSLDALCERLGVNHAHRQLHGALLDTQLLAEVFFALTRGQESLAIDGLFSEARTAEQQRAAELPRPSLLRIQPTPEALAAHEHYLSRLKAPGRDVSIWAS